MGQGIKGMDTRPSTLITQAGTKNLITEKLRYKFVPDLGIEPGTLSEWVGSDFKAT